MSEELTTAMETQPVAQPTATESQPTAQSTASMADTSVFSHTDYSKALKYYSQLPKDVTEDTEAMESVKDCATIADLVKSLKDTKKSLSESKRDEGDYIKFPKEGSSTEERVAFLKKLGVPSSKDGYKLDISDDATDEFKEFGKKFSEIFYNAAMTPEQGRRVFKAISELIVDGGKKQEAHQKEYMDSFDKRQTEYLKTITKVDDEVKSLKERDLSLTNVFLHDTNTGEELRKSGLLLDPAFLHKIAEYQEQRQPKASFNNSSKETNVSSAFDYSDEFARTYGGRK